MRDERQKWFGHVERMSEERGAVKSMKVPNGWRRERKTEKAMTGCGEAGLGVTMPG